MDSFISWVGGKKLLRKEIINRFPENPPERYIEVFGGAGWVLFGKDIINGQLEVFNDINSDLINLYRCIKYHADALKKELEFVTHSREIFFDMKSQLNSTGLTDIQRAARFFCLIKMSFCSKMDTYGTNARVLDPAIEKFDAIAQRLKRVVIENRSYRDLIKIYDRKNALFYLDPPYFDSEDYYNQPFGKEDHEKLRQILDNIKGKFILSYNDIEYIRELYSGYNIDAVERQHNMAHGKNKRYSELIIRNY